MSLKRRLRDLTKEEKEISITTSEWVKARNTVFLAFIDSANNKILDEIEKSIKNNLLLQSNKLCGAILVSYKCHKKYINTLIKNSQFI